MTDFLYGRRFQTTTPVFVLLILLFTFFPASPAPAWEYSEFSFDSEARLAMIATAGIWNPYLEVKGIYHAANPGFLYHSYTAGTYVKVAPWLKLGAFYSLQGGARHLEDWSVDIGPDRHSWDEVSPSRLEHLLMADATPRFLLPWMPGGSWVGAFKIRYAYNFYNDHQTLLLRPGLTWVWMQNREPLLNLSLQYPVYLALNFGDAVVYGHGPYLTALWHLNDWMKLEGRFQYLMKKYAKTEHGGPWVLNSHHLGIGVGLIFTPDFSS